MEAKDLTFMSRDGRRRSGAYFLVTMQQAEIQVLSMVGPNPDLVIEAQLMAFRESKAKAELYLKVMLVICEACLEGVISNKEAYRAGMEYDAKMQDEIELMSMIAELIVDMQTWHAGNGFKYRMRTGPWLRSGPLDQIPL